MPVGAELAGDGVGFRVWAPARRQVEVLLEDEGPHQPENAHPLTADAGGYFSGVVPGIGAGTRYRYRLDGDRAFPDPASRFQPEGPEGPSQVVDPAAYRWSDAAWRGPDLGGQVIYELHLGTFTAEGTYRAAAARLPYLQRLGITAVELMPLAEFAGEFGWGYDGVDLFAPSRLYGEPDDLRALVDAAHGLGLSVILDVVYNHLGPRGNFLREFSPHYFSDRHNSEWGDGIDYDGPHSGPVRELVLANAGYWISEYHFDGLRLDATQDIHDDSAEHLVRALARRAREGAGERSVLMIAENEPQQAALVRPAEAGGLGLDALWNDDFHHSACVAATGRAEAYLSPFRGRASELLATVKWGFLYQGQLYPWQRQRRGTPSLDLAAPRFVCYLDNHDQVANSPRGERLHQSTSPGRLRALTTLLLLAPQTPLLFQGQEFAASAPFLYFADHPPELAKQVRAGRYQFLSQFPGVAAAGCEAAVPDPASRDTFARCKLDWREAERNEGILALHRDLLRLRRDEEVFRRQDARRLDGAALGAHLLVLRFFTSAGNDRLLLVNLGGKRAVAAAPEPLLAPPAGRRWRTLWSSEGFAYGGSGTAPLLDSDDDGWHFPGEAAVVLAAREDAGDGGEGAP
ncbi:MAG TPA: malto-oligosyltrehalose trehalohydrolase [Thermoanaerobaculia bacterium]|jgi:maltooligosyltrehalose trehalohydrolase|nr:malto-oligosyltrehalose trehalohydrolase [Thermoanaerobaculia bacterium]